MLLSFISPYYDKISSGWLENVSLLVLMITRKLQSRCFTPLYSYTKIYDRYQRRWLESTQHKSISSSETKGSPDARAVQSSINNALFRLGYITYQLDITVFLVLVGVEMTWQFAQPVLNYDPTLEAIQLHETGRNTVQARGAQHITMCDAVLWVVLGCLGNGLGSGIGFVSIAMPTIFLCTMPVLIPLTIHHFAKKNAASDPYGGEFNTLEDYWSTYYISTRLPYWFKGGGREFDNINLRIAKDPGILGVKQLTALGRCTQAIPHIYDVSTMEVYQAHGELKAPVKTSMMILNSEQAGLGLQHPSGSSAIPIHLGQINCGDSDCRFHSKQALPLLRSSSIQRQDLQLRQLPPTYLAYWFYPWLSLLTVDHLGEKAHSNPERLDRNDLCSSENCSTKFYIRGPVPRSRKLSTQPPQPTPQPPPAPLPLPPPRLSWFSPQRCW